MHFIRRAAARAATSQITSTRSIATRSTPFAIRSSKPVTVSPLYQRWNSSKPVDSVNTSDVMENKSELEEAIAAAESAAVEPEINDLNSNSAQRLAEEAPRSVDEYDTGVDAAVESVKTSYPARRPMEPLQLTPNNTIYVGNLVFELSNEKLQQLFAPFGKITDAGIRLDARGLSKGFAFVSFETVEQATAAIEGMSGYIHEGRKMMVAYSMPRKEPRARKPASRTLFIGNISFEVTDSDLNDVFRDIKNCVDVRVAVDRRTGQPRGFAHADFLDVKSASQAIEKLEKITMYGRQLRIDFAHEETKDRNRA